MGKAPSRRIRRIAVLFSGGDAPGMNAYLRALVRLAWNRHEIEVVGIKSGFSGLVEVCDLQSSMQAMDGECLRLLESQVGRRGLEDSDQQIVRLDSRSVSGIVDHGGIIVGSTRCPAYQEDRELRGQVVKLLDNLAVDAVVVVGGDGSLRGAADLAKESGMLVIGVPATIDNDFPLSEVTLGWDTAVNTVVRTVRDVNDTARSHRRIMVLETMGRNSGLLAETAAVASGAEIAVTPERGVLDGDKLLEIAMRIEDSLKRGRSHFIVLVAEGVELADDVLAGSSKRSSPGEAVTNYLVQYFNEIDIRGSLRKVDVRLTVLGYVQRGGSPTADDRLLAANFAEKTLESLVKNQPKSGVLCVTKGRIERRPFDAPPLPYHEAELRRIDQLQKDISDPGCDDTALPTGKMKKKMHRSERRRGRPRARRSSRRSR